MQADHEHHHQTGHDAPTSHFPTDPTGIPESAPTQIVDLADGDDGRAADRAGREADRRRDGAHARLQRLDPRPDAARRARAPSSSSTSSNDGDLEATVHWHGLRLDNRYDGTHETQAPIPVGGSFTYRIEFPDPGVYWYHPHIREDYGQELGLYGNILVVPAEPDYWPPAHRELLADAGRRPDRGRQDRVRSAATRRPTRRWAASATSCSSAARPSSRSSAQPGEVVRLYLTNTANTRVFNVALPGARMKLVGGDSGRCEREELVESVIIAPSERVVVDVLFERAGRGRRSSTARRRRTYPLATIDVGGEPAAPALAGGFDDAAAQPGVDRASASGSRRTSTRRPTRRSRSSPRWTSARRTGPASYACPMHPEVVSDEPGTLPEVRHEAAARRARRIRHAATGTARHHGHGHGHGHHGHARRAATRALRGIEWEDDMVDVNRMTTPANTRWKFVDRDTGAANHAIDWRFRVGDLVKLRLVNEMDSDHPMHHPFHIHGAGRFVVLARDGVAEQNLVWKDTVLVRTGETVDILLDVTNPGVWMAHCHIAEHHESGMMFSFTVDPADV